MHPNILGRLNGVLVALAVELGGRAAAERHRAPDGRGIEAPEKIYGKWDSGASAIAAATVDEARKTLAMAATGEEGVTTADAQRIIDQWGRTKEHGNGGPPTGSERSQLMTHK